MCMVWVKEDEIPEPKKADCDIGRCNLPLAEMRKGGKDGAGIKISQPTKVDCDIERGNLPLVGVRGFEPPASSSRTKRATKLRYTP